MHVHWKTTVHGWAPSIIMFALSACQFNSVVRTLKMAVLAVPALQKVTPYSKVKVFPQQIEVGTQMSQTQRFLTTESTDPGRYLETAFFSDMC